MNYKEFVGQVQHRLELAEMGAAVRATRATLTTLGERLQEGEATDVASPLPSEIGRFVSEADHGQRFDYDDFLGRVAERGGVDKPDANYQAQQIVALVSEVVPPGNIRKIRDQLPEEYGSLFEFVGEREQE